MAKKNAKGRSRGEGGFVQVFHYMTRTAAWRSLKPQERALWLELAGLFNGANNGFIGLSARQAADRCNMNKDTATRCFVTLQDRGFIRLAQQGKFHGAATSAEWLLTHLPDDRTGHRPSKAFLAWRPEEKKPVPKEGHVGPKRGTRPDQIGPIGPVSGDGLKQSTPPISPISGDTLRYTIPCAADVPACGGSDADRVARPPKGRRSERAAARVPSTDLPTIEPMEASR